MEIYVMTYGHPLWDETASNAENCSWKAGPYLSKKMRNNGFSETERVLVATKNRRPVGYCTFSMKDELPEDSDYSPFIGFVFVDEKQRGRRISEKLIGKALDYAKSIGYETVYILSGEIGLYEKYGFVKIGDEETAYGTRDQLFRKKTV